MLWLAVLAMVVLPTAALLAAALPAPAIHSCCGDAVPAPHPANVPPCCVVQSVPPVAPAIVTSIQAPVAAITVERQAAPVVTFAQVSVVGAHSAAPSPPHGSSILRI